MTLKSISIIVPVYNVEDYIQKCIESILNQSFTNYELLLIDDGSKDNSIKIVEEYLQKDLRIKLIHQENMGLSEARNTGIKHSKGDYILFVDSDDYLEEDSLEKISKIIKSSDYDIILNNGYRIESSNKRLIRNNDNRYYISGRQYMIENIKRDTYFPAVWLNVYSSRLIKENQIYFKKGRLHEDVEWFPYLLNYCSKIKTTNIILYNYNIRNNSITTQKDQHKNGLDLIKSVIELKTSFSSLEKAERKIFFDYLANMYLNGTYIGHLNSKEYNRFFPIKNAHLKKTVLKSLIFIISPKIYFYFRGKY